MLMQHLVSPLSVSGRPVHRLRENGASVCQVGHCLRSAYNFSYFPRNVNCDIDRPEMRTNTIL